MKNIFRKKVYLLLPFSYCLNSRFRIFLFFILFTLSTHAQNAEWTSEVNPGDQIPSTTDPVTADWLFDVITTADGNFLAVGFANEDEGNPEVTPDEPAYVLMNATGQVLRDDAYSTQTIDGDPARGRLYTVVEAENDFYYAGGHVEYLGPLRRALIAKINKSTLDAEYIEFLPSGFVDGRIDDLKNVASGNYLLLSGRGKELGNSPRDFWVAAVDYDGQVLAELTIESPFDKDWNDLSIEFEIDPNNGNTNIFYVTSFDKNGNTIGDRRVDSDIEVGRIMYDPAEQEFTTSDKNILNSIKQRENAMISQADVGVGNIFWDYPPVISDHYGFGPKYKNTDFERVFTNCNSNTLSDIERWSNGSEDRAYGIVLTEDAIVVSCALNRLVMNNPHINSDFFTVLDQCTASSPCNDFEGDDYIWSEGYLLFLDRTDLSLTKATHLGTFTGEDYWPSLIKTSDGGFAVSGSISGCPEGLGETEGNVHGLVVKVNADGEVEWRQDYQGPASGMCAFGLTEASDGGIVLIGNTGGEESWAFVKAAYPCDYSGVTIEPNSGKEYILGTDEVWDTDQIVAAKVIVPENRMLTIDGANVEFVDSRAFFENSERVQIGITVKKGGKLRIVNSTLTGFSCNGDERMWDGIAVEGDPSIAQGNSLGIADLWMFGSTISNARKAITVTSARIGTYELITENPLTGTNSSATVTRYVHGGAAESGAKVVALFSDFVNNIRTGIFMKYDPDKSHSRFHSCNFISDGPVLDPIYWAQTEENDFNSFVPRGSSTHVSNWANRIQLSNCNFTGSTDIALAHRPVGVGAYDGKLTISGGSMSDLLVGVQSSGPIGGVQASSGIFSMEFDNVYQGAVLSHTSIDRVRNCDFLNIPNSVPGLVAGDDIVDAVGLACNGAKGANVYGNLFSGADPFQLSFGLIVRSSLDDGADIMENEFESLYIGNQFEGTNNALIASCNDYDLIGRAAWAVMEFNGGGALGPQGQAGTEGLKADNEFFNNCIGYSHIFSQLPFDYYDRSGNSNRPEELCVSDDVNYDFSDPSSNLSCFVPEPPCPVLPCDEIVRWFEESDRSLKSRNIALQAILHPGFDDEGLEHDIKYDDAIEILNIRDEQEDRAMLMSTYYSMRDYNNALLSYNAYVPANSTEQNFKDYMGHLINAQEDINELDETTQENLLAFTAMEDRSGIMAVSFDKFLKDDALLFDAVDLPGDPRSNASAQDLSEPEGPSTVVKPNPFTDVLVFDLSAFDQQQFKMYLTSADGKLIQVAMLQGGASNTISTHDLPSGLLFFQLKDEFGQLIESGKLVHINN